MVEVEANWRTSPAWPTPGLQAPVNMPGDDVVQGPWFTRRHAGSAESTAATAAVPR